MSSQQDQRGNSPKLEAVIQKLEESLLHSDGSSGKGSLTLQGDTPACGATPVPITTRIFQIITSNLADQPAGQSFGANEEESQAPRGQPSPSQMDRDQLLVEHTSLTERVGQIRDKQLHTKLDQMLVLQSAVDSDQDSEPAGSIQSQSTEKTYSQKLQTYQEAQKKQVQFVQKLQTKLLQCQKRCEELEEQLKTSECEKKRLLLQAHLDSAERQKRVEEDLNAVIKKQFSQLQEEQRRSASLSQVNSVLREQLDQAGSVNKELTESLWKAHRDIQLCDTHLRREQETSASRSSGEQARVRALWRQAASLRSTFILLRTFTDRTLSDMRGECVAVSRQLRVTCKNFEVRVTEDRSCGGVEMSALERQLKDKLKEAMGLQAVWEAEKIELTCRILELTNTLKQLQSPNSEKDVSIHSNQISLDRTETRRAEDKAELETLHADFFAVQNTLYQIHQLVCSEGDSSLFSLPVHGQSPLRNTTFRAVENMLSKHQDQSQDLNARLGAALEKVDAFQDRLQERDAERIKLEQMIQEVQRESQEAKKALEENLQGSNRDRCSLELLSSEKGSLEKLLSGLQQEVNSQREEQEVLRSSLLDLQRQRDLLRQQREDLETQLAHQCTETHRGERILQELEERHSNLCKEYFTMKEALSRIDLQKEVLEEDKASLSVALTKMETHSASQERSLTKLQSRQAALKDSFTKMAALSEGLAKDKVELNRIVLQVESEKAELDKRRREAEAARAAAREDAAQTQKEMINLLAEKQALESFCIQLQEMCQKLEAELCFLQKVKAEALEENSQVREQMQTVQEELCVCRMELEAKTSACWDREELAKDHAALDVRLRSAELKAWRLQQELLALRAEKESLETSLFESQELFMLLKAQCSGLEAERSSLILANESLTRDASQMQAEAEQQQELEKLAEVERNALVMLNATEQRHRGQLEAELQEKALSQNKAKTAALAEKLASLQQHQATAGLDGEPVIKHDQNKSESLHQQLQETESNLIERQRDLLEAHKKLQGSAQEQDKLRKEAVDLRQLLGDQTREKEALQVSNQELKAFTKRAESDNSSLKLALGEKEQKLSILEECKRSVNQELTALRGRMRQQEKSHLQARRELQELRRQIKVTEGENSRQKQELLELQAVCQEEEEQEEEEEARREAFTLRQRLLECEAGKEAGLNEVAVLQRRMRELETAEQESQELLQENEVCQHQSDQKHRETTAQLEAELRDSRTTVKELTVKAGLAENRTQSLKEELSLTRAKRRDLELSMAGLNAALRSTVGINCAKPSDKQPSPSPQRRNVHEKGDESISAGSVRFLHHDDELNVKSLHTAIQEFQEQLRDTQRERDEAKAQIVKLNRDVSDLRGSQEKTSTNILELQKSLEQSEEGKQQKAETSLSLQQDVVHRLEREKKLLQAEVAQLMTSLQAAWTESRTLQDKLDTLHGLESCANAQQLRLKESLVAAESRVNCLELSQRTFEGELQRAQLRAAELDAEVGALQERLADLRKKLSKSEDRCAALQVSEERLAASLARAEQHESQLREQIHKLSNLLSNNRVNIEGLQEQTAQLQRILTACERDRKLLQDRLDETRDALSESKKLNRTLTEQTQNLQQAQKDSDLKVSELEKHCRTLKESLEQQEAELKTSQQGPREKEEIQEKLNNLQSCLQELQGERADMEKVLMHLKRDKSALRKTLEKVELERLRKKEEAASVTRQNALMEQTVCNLQQDLTEKQEMLETLKVQISQLEHSHAQNLLEVIARHHQELDLETERLRDGQLQAEQALETRERAHHQRVRCLEEQVLTLKEQLDQETRRRQAYFNQMLQPGV